MIELSSDTLNEVLETNENVIVQYGAGWCGNCRIVKPKFKQLAEQQPSVTFVYVDAEKFPNARQFADVSHLPTFASFKRGKLVNQKSGNKIDIVEELLHEVTSH